MNPVCMRRVSPSRKNPLSKLLQASGLTAGCSNGSTKRPDSFAASEQERRRHCAAHSNSMSCTVRCPVCGSAGALCIQFKAGGARSRHDLVFKANMIAFHQRTGDRHAFHPHNTVLDARPRGQRTALPLRPRL
jgi:hypothetical protein